ncbi:hypothetical protein BSPLISOX_1698, partial [uncultured Gammaproteobacteria bacterium]
MKIIKLFVIHMLLLSSFQTLAFSITTKDVSTPEGTAAVINLNINDSSNLLEFAIVPDDALDSEKFTLNGEGRDLIPYTLTFEATAFNQRRGSIPGKNIYKVKVRASLTTSIGKWDIFTETVDKIITVTVEKFRITTADVSTPENRHTTIRLTTDQDSLEDVDIIFSIPSSGADIDKFELSGFDNRNLLFNSTDFEAREDHTYSVEVTARRTDTDGTTTKTTTKTITVTVTDIVDDEAPTNIQITNVNLTAGHPAIAPIGILSADDKDTEASKLIFTTDSIGFTIVKGEKGYKLMTTKTIADGTVVTVTASDGTHSTDKDFVIKVRAVEESLTINMKDNFFTPKNKNREITLVVNQAGVSFFIIDNPDSKFTLNATPPAIATKLIFKATEYDNDDNGKNSYSVKIGATKGEGDNKKTVEKILTVTVQNTVDEDDEDDEGTEDTGGSGKEKGPVKAGNAEVTAQAVRKESKSASKLLLSKVGKTLMGRL